MKAGLTKSVSSKEGERLRQCLITTRRDKGLTQQDLAERLGKKQNFVSNVESGVRRLDVVEFLFYCDALEASPQSILKKLTRKRET